MVLFGLFHGLLFMPTILSLIGPKETQLDDKDEEMEQNGTDKRMKLEERKNGIDNKVYDPWTKLDYIVRLIESFKIMITD